MDCARAPTRKATTVTRLNRKTETPTESGRTVVLKNLKYGWLFVFALMLGACAGTDELPDELTPPSASRQSELTRIYDRMGSESESTGEEAAQSAAAGDDRDRRFMNSLWGTREKSALGARRYAAALSAKGFHEDAIDWYERAYMALDTGDEMLPYLRYDMAFEYLKLGRNDDAINLLANRMSTEPLPAELAKKYDNLIQRASRG